MISKEELNTCVERVEALLEDDPNCRNSDKYLLSKYIKEFHGLDLPADILAEIPSFESITRARRKLQENGDYPPLSDVESKRAEIQTSVREWAVET